ncbi:MAG TPA: hypothetical protein VK886_03045 [Vicinamibacterales bacterium]|nr:hypothetical protein [Vicinamibacterales bacterium]
MNLHALGVFSLLISLPSPVEQSLRELAKEGLGTQNSLSVVLPVVTVGDLLETSELILHGRIGHSATRLTSNDSIVVTDYAILPIRIFKQTKVTGVAAQPGPTNPIVVTIAGGTVVDGEHRLTTIVNLYPASEMFRVSEEVFLFLVFDPTEKTFLLNGGPFGAFRVTDGSVLPMTKSVTSRRGDVLVSTVEFMGDVGQRLQARPRR